MTVILAAVMLVVVVAPHVLDLRVTPPATAIALWLSSLVMRALLVLAAVVLLLFVAPSTELFAAIAHWCWHSVVPILATHLGIDGHRMVDVAVVLPAVVLAMSVLSMAIGLVRAARAGGSGGIDRRLDELMAIEPQPEDLRRRALRLVAGGVVSITVAIVAIVRSPPRPRSIKPTAP